MASNGQVGKENEPVDTRSVKMLKFSLSGASRL